MDESKSDKFKRLATKRVNTILNNVRLLKQLSNKNNYEFTDSERRKIFSSIRQALNEADDAFKGRDRTKDKFKL